MRQHTFNVRVDILQSLAVGVAPSAATSSLRISIQMCDGKDPFQGRVPSKQFVCGMRKELRICSVTMAAAVAADLNLTWKQIITDATKSSNGTSFVTVNLRLVRKLEGGAEEPALPGNLVEVEFPEEQAEVEEPPHRSPPPKKRARALSLTLGAVVPVSGTAEQEVDEMHPNYTPEHIPDPGNLDTAWLAAAG